jgi:hypothetical protein
LGGGWLADAAERGGGVAVLTVFSISATEYVKRCASRGCAAIGRKSFPFSWAP